MQSIKEQLKVEQKRNLENEEKIKENERQLSISVADLANLKTGLQDNYGGDAIGMHLENSEVEQLKKTLEATQNARNDLKQEVEHLKNVIQIYPCSDILLTKLLFSN